MTAASESAIVYLQQLPDGSWIANASWAGRMLTDGGTEEEPLLQRIAARLLALSNGNKAGTMKLTRVPQSGAREEREQALESVLP